MIVWKAKVIPYSFLAIRTMPVPELFHRPFTSSSANISESLHPGKNYLVIDAKGNLENSSDITWITAPNNFLGKVLWFFFGKPERIKTAIQTQFSANEHKFSFSTPLTFKQILQETGHREESPTPNNSTTSSSNEPLAKIFHTSQSVACPKPMDTVSGSNSLSHQLFPSPRCERYEISWLGREKILFSQPSTRHDIISAVIETLYGEVKSFKPSREKKHNALHKQIADLVYHYAPRSFLEQFSFHEKEINAEKANEVYNHVLFSIAFQELQNYDDYQKNTYPTSYDWNEPASVINQTFWAERTNFASDMKTKTERIFGVGSEIAKEWEKRRLSALKEMRQTNKDNKIS